MRLRRARISVSCRASTEFTFSMPERSGKKPDSGDVKQGDDGETARLVVRLLVNFVATGQGPD